MKCRVCQTSAAPHELARKQGEGADASGVCFACLVKSHDRAWEAIHRAQALFYHATPPGAARHMMQALATAGKMP